LRGRRKRKNKKQKCRYNIKNKGHFDCTAGAVGEKKKQNPERDDNFPGERGKRKKEKSAR
jgi:hypothetical protein